MSNSIVLDARNLVKTFQNGNVSINAINDVSFSIEEGKLVVILGPSGAGKSTLLNLIGGMEDVKWKSICRW